MADIKLSVLNRERAYLDALAAVLAEFQVETGVHVEVEHISAWSDFTRLAINQRGPDVSEVGSTRVGSLMAMNTLHAFTPQEINQIGGLDDFLPVSLETCRQPRDPNLYAIPYSAECYVVLYRRDLLAKAGINPAEAFASHAAIDQTAARLKAVGVEIPFEIPIKSNYYTLIHGLASYVWTAGGEYCSTDGKHVLLDSPKVMGAIMDYMGLLRHVAPAARKTLVDAPEMLFAEGKSAILYENLQWRIQVRAIAAEVEQNLAAAPVPGQHFTGGSNFVIWKFAHNEKAALALVKKLSSPDVHARLVRAHNRLSYRQSVLQLPEVQLDPLRSVMAQGIRTGRTYPSNLLWAMIGDRLGFTLSQIGQEFLTSPDADLAEIVRRHIDLLTKKLNLALSAD